MSARRSTTPAVTLFPFLAVLICAMGALILLLLITTRRIRQQSVERATELAEVPAAVEPAAPPPVEPDTEASPEPAAPESAADSFDDPEWISEPHLPAPFPAAELHERRMAELREEWERTVEGLERQQAQLRATLEELESSLSDDERREQSQQSALEMAWRQLEETEALVESARRDRDSLALRQSQLENDIRARQARLQEVIDQQSEAAGRFEVLPFDGQSGTTRRPILIECTEHGFLFLSDGVMLTPNDVNGFTPEQNPLLAGAEALLSYWQARELSSRNTDDPTGRPYVLLIVRPGGTLAYYIARRLLEPLKEPFGYELVTDEKFVAPETDPQATAALERAIDYLVSERNRLQARTQGTLPVAESLRFSDGNGGFYLDEVERLRENTNTVHFGGREVERTEPGGARGAAPRVVEFPRAGQSGPAPESAATGNSLVPPAGLYDARIAPDPNNNVSPPRRRTFDVDGEVGETASIPADPGRETVQQPRAPAGPSLPAPGATSGGEQGIDVNDPQWGLRSPGSSIGLERDVTIRIDAEAVRVGNESPLHVTPGVSREELQRDLAESLDAHVRGWGRPPNSFFWLPNVKFEVAPGGHQSYQRLHDLIDDWDLRSNVDFVLESTLRQVD